MASFVKTITNRLNLFGADVPNKWGVMLWGDNWGYGNGEVIEIVYKNIGESLALADAVFPQAIFQRTFNQILNVTGDMSYEGLMDPRGYNIIFVTSANAESRPLTSYTTISATDATYTTQVNTQTTWTLV
jgi:hypothetical protein